MQGFVYLLLNPAFPKLLKIGRTVNDPHLRANELSTTGTPDKFLLLHSVFTKDCILLEELLHQHFDSKRYNKNREFFEVSVAEAITKIEQLNNEEIFLPKSQSSESQSRVIEIVVYAICFYFGNQAGRVGVLNVDDHCDIKNDRTDSQVGLESYIASKDFQIELSQFYKSKSESIQKLDKSQSALFSLLSSHVEDNFTIYETRRFQVRRSFLKKAQIVISSNLKEACTINDGVLLKDNQTIYLEHQKLSENGAFKMMFEEILSIFENEQDKAKIEHYYFQSKEMQYRFEVLLNSAPSEILFAWKKLLSTENITSENIDEHLFEDGSLETYTEFFERLSIDIENSKNNRWKV
jgi:hypothetical protein